MSLKAGDNLGPYHVLSAIGAGGMGEVFRAHDSRLGRDVAIKIMPESFAADAERLARFEQEARAVAALNHPNILAVFDIGEHSGNRYIVTELLEGDTLRSKLASGALPIRRVQEYALQIAQGLAVAHDKGIVHRDLKPENIFISKDGRAKILDFGLAKQNAMTYMAAGATMTAVPQTTPGVVMGTVGYMSPEQVAGKPADHRSDIFSFGAVLHEMLSGAQPFRRDTSAETMTAILKDDPPEIVSTSSRMISPASERIMRRCLEKDPEQRFQSAKDLAFALEAMSGSTTASSSATAISGSKRIALPLVLVVGISAALLTFAATAFFRSRKEGTPTFHQLTASRGFVRMARFAPDGETIVFAGAWNGDPMKLWFERADTIGFSPLAAPDADLLSVSPTGELAIALDRTHVNPNIPVGTLARISFTGGSPREVLERVTDADWSPDGSALAITRPVGNHFRLEYPIGKVLVETSGYISHLRFSHRGDKIAFMDHPLYGDDRGYVCVVDLAGNKKTLTPEWASEQGLAWTPDDSEIWFDSTDEQSGNFHVLRAVNVSGKIRVLLRAPGDLQLQDIAKDGRVLLSTASVRDDIYLGDVARGKETDLTWFDYTWGQTLSNDAKWYFFSTQESGENGNYSIYARKTDGSPALRLGDGDITGLSGDGKWVIATLPANDRTVQLLPVGAGEPKTFQSATVHFGVARSIFWMADNKSFLLAGREEGHGPRAYLQSVEGGEPKPVTPEDVQPVLISPDRKSILTQNLQGDFFIYPVEGGTAQKLTAIPTGDSPAQWLQDGSLLVRASGDRTIVDIYQLDLTTGAKKPWKKFAAKDKVGMAGIYAFQITPDASHYLQVDYHTFSTLFVVKGLK